MSAAEQLHPRFAEPGLVEALADTPVVLIHGPRQCGKTTLAQQVGEKRGYAYFSFDEDVTLAAAVEDPVGFVSTLPERSILDEVQRAPAIFSASFWRRSSFRNCAGTRVGTIRRSASIISGIATPPK